MTSFVMKALKLFWSLNVGIFGLLLRGYIVVANAQVPLIYNGLRALSMSAAVLGGVFFFPGNRLILIKVNKKLTAKTHRVF